MLSKAFHLERSERTTELVSRGKNPILSSRVSSFAELNRQPSLVAELDEKTTTTLWKISKEILVTEKTYINALTTLEKDYYVPLKSLIGSEKQILDVEGLDDIFGNLMSLHALQEDFFESYRELLNEQIKRENIPLIGSFMANWAKQEVIGREYSTFAKTYERAVMLLGLKMKTKNTLADFLTSPEGDREKVGLLSLLITPIQRIPRYEMLLQTLKNRLPSGHPENANLNDAIQAIASLNNLINDGLAESESEEFRLRAVLQSFHPRFQSALYTPGRELIAKGFAEYKTNKAWKKCVAYLFTDLLLFTKKGKRGEELEIIEQVNLINTTIDISTRKRHHFKLHELRSKISEPFIEQVSVSFSPCQKRLHNFGFWSSSLNQALDSLKSNFDKLIAINCEAFKKHVEENFLTMKHLASLLSVGHTQEMRRGDILIEEGAVPTKLCYIHSGEVSIEKMINGQNQLIAIRSAGEILGDFGFLNRDQNTNASVVVTETESKVTMICFSTIDLLFSSDHKLFQRFSQMLCYSLAMKFILQQTQKTNTDRMKKNDVPNVSPLDPSQHDSSQLKKKSKQTLIRKKSLINSEVFVSEISCKLNQSSGTLILTTNYCRFVSGLLKKKTVKINNSGIQNVNEQPPMWLRISVEDTDENIEQYEFEFSSTHDMKAVSKFFQQYQDRYKKPHTLEDDILLSAEDWSSIEAAGTPRNLAPEESLTEQGEMLSNLYIVKEGHCQIKLKDESIAKIMPGELIGELSFILKMRASGSVFASSEGAMLSQIPFEALNQMCLSSPLFSGKLFKYFAKRIGERFLQRERHMLSKLSGENEDL